ncbi:TonB-dependent receptor [Agrobacterium sp. V1]|uniref:TonB-dependent receptor n=1 Tax=Agrobacterium sp. V1 TaxID=3061957 RepID=UPI00267249C7|nr:TonB-dependent receptor [Agrobacterium sp. V1]MDO3445468.1 TonB-dependent receptor [Agrobacterium sp. V1]
MQNEHVSGQRRHIEGGVTVRRLPLSFFRRSLMLGTALALACAVHPLPVHAQSTQTTARERRISFDIPSQPLSRALVAYSSTTGTQLFFDANLARGKSAPAVRGSFTRNDAIAQLLAGSGLDHRINGSTITITGLNAPAGNGGISADGSTLLDPILIEGINNWNSPPVYAGGQIATGGALGVLGNRDVMSTPFTVTNYTAKLIENQNAQSVADVVKNDPAIRNVEPTNVGNGNYFIIRGVQVGNGALAYNGLFGVAPNSQTTLAGIERVEILKGPGAFLGGLSPSGVGGVINLVPKRAEDEPLTQFTTTYTTDSQFGGHLDIGRRFGDGKEWGARANILYRNGDTSISDQAQELSNGTVALDYRGERFRFAVDLGQQVLDTERMSNTVIAAPGVALARPPKPQEGWVSPWNYSDFTDRYAAVSTEFDISDQLSIYAKGGLSSMDWNQAVEAGTGLLPNGDFTATGRRYLIDIDRRSAEAGLRASFDTGPVSHDVTLSVNGYRADRSSATTRVLSVTQSNIYNPVFAPAPTIIDTPIGLQSETTFTSVALSDTLSVFDERLQLTLGLRKQYVEVDNFNIVTGSKTGAYESDALTPVVGLSVKPWDNTTIYASYIEGLSAGQTVPDTYSNGGEVLSPYVTEQYEAGVKVDWGDILTTLSIFQTTQASGVANSANNTFSADGETVYRGVEFNVAGEITPSLRVLGGLVLLDAETTKTANGLYDGKKAAGAPDYTVTLGAEWDPEFLSNLTLSARMNSTGSSYVDAANLQKMSGWNTFDFGARYTWERENAQPIIFQANLTNAFNEAYWSTFPGFNLLYPSASRALTISTTFKF